VASNLAGGVRNVGLVYIDAAGVSRKAVIKSVAKGMVVGRMPNGQQIVVGTGDGGVVPPEAYSQDVKRDDRSEKGYQGGAPGYGPDGYGNAATQPPAYSGVGEPLSGQPTHEKQYY
jgi:spartin